MNEYYQFNSSITEETFDKITLQPDLDLLYDESSKIVKIFDNRLNNLLKELL